MQITVKAKDLYYLPRVENLEKEYKKCEETFTKLEEEFENGLHFETISCLQLTVLSDRMEVIKSLMESLENRIKTLRLEISN
jgi:hypothetical protein